MKVIFKNIVNSALVALAASLSVPAFAQNSNPSDVVNLSKVKFQIVNATFVTKLNSPKAQFTQSNPDRYHGLLVTVQVTKSAGEALTLTCQDIALHYRYGQQSDIARCFGLSSFAPQLNEDRTMELYSEGWGKSTTRLATTLSDTVYIDVFFKNMEADTSDLYLFIAQPTGAHFTTRGWKKN
jgi:hypothetical protein